MQLTEYFLAQLDREAALTRKAIERVPEGKGGFKPHERSMELGMLATLTARMPGWIASIVELDSLDLDAPESEKFRTKAVAAKAEMLALLDDGVAEARRALSATSEEHLEKKWAFKMRGMTMTEKPRKEMISDSVFSHLAHHRGQLTVYLRLLESSVPALFGPSADEKF
ncbi:MAG TPA: DinB family protein [Terracidiphilus sp.]|nr:DinB family protein [Terracidiphilus sp.]